MYLGRHIRTNRLKTLFFAMFVFRLSLLVLETAKKKVIESLHKTRIFGLKKKEKEKTSGLDFFIEAITHTPFKF